MRLTILILFLSLYVSSLSAQLSGKVTDNKGMALPYVNIYVKNSSKGTTTNQDGQYVLKLENGQHDIVYQFIGFKTVSHSVVIDNNTVIKDVSLDDASYTMPEILISANAEDPAYEIIRKAQSKRKYFKEIMSNYECDAYMRGFNKIYKAPEKIMGIEIDDMEGTLDSTRQGVIYLSESVSKLYVKGSDSKEIMQSSKISGNDQGYSFNSAQEMDFNFYDNTLDINRKIISPIAANAMAYYEYKLEGAHYDENGQLVNKIKVTPKSKYTAAFSGHLYINEDLWNINSLELSVTKEATQLAFIDTLKFKQNFIPIKGERWQLFSNIIRFRMGAFGFEVGGNFACVYSNYVIEQLDASVFNSEIYVVEREANKRSESYWDSIRPIPLTIEEKVDYIKKDSIRIVKESPEYLDSIDKKNNRFKPMSILGSYNNRNSLNNSSWQISSPISNIEVNTIQGWNGSLKFEYNKSFNKEKTKRLNAALSLNYGFSEEVWRPELSLSYLANRRNNLRFGIQAGKALSQFNRLNPISNKLNSLFTLLARRNYLKAYDKEFVSMQISRDLGYIFFGRLSLDYESRTSLINNYDGGWYYKDSREFSQNLEPFENHKALIFRASLRIKIGEKIVSYPDRKYRVGSSWPTIWLHYKKGISGLDSDVNYDLLHATLSDSYSVGTLGTFNLYMHGGLFLKPSEYFMDYYHFMGNQTHIGYPADYNRSFLLMPYYRFSTNQDFAQVHLQHNFKGFVLGKIPLLRRLEWHLVGGFKYLTTDDGNTYRELHVGLDNLGFHVFRLLRVDAVWSHADHKFANFVGGTKFGVVVGLKIDL